MLLPCCDDPLTPCQHRTARVTTGPQDFPLDGLPAIPGDMHLRDGGGAFVYTSDDRWVSLGGSIALRGNVGTFHDLPYGAAPGETYITADTGWAYVADGRGNWTHFTIAGVPGPTGPVGPAGHDGKNADSIRIMGTIGSTTKLPKPGHEVPGEIYIVGDTYNKQFLDLFAGRTPPDPGHGIVWREKGLWEDIGPIRGPRGNDGAEPHLAFHLGNGIHGEEGHLYVTAEPDAVLSGFPPTTVVPEEWSDLGRFSGKNVTVIGPPGPAGYSPPRTLLGRDIPGGGRMAHQLSIDPQPGEYGYDHLANELWIGDVNSPLAVHSSTGAGWVPWTTQPRLNPGETFIVVNYDAKTKRRYIEEIYHGRP